jgi:hypothetical protein
MKILRRLLNEKKILKINFTKNVNNVTFDNLYLALKGINNKDYCCVFFSLNTKCSLHQSIVMANIIQDYKNKSKSVPIFTFAGDSCIGPSILILLSGSKFIADENTLFGFYDFTLQKTNFSNFINERKIKVRINTEGENKLRLSPFDHYKNNDIDWALDLLRERRSIFLDEIIRIKFDSCEEINYTDKNNENITVKKGNIDDIMKWRKILDENLGSTFMYTSQMKSLGLVDSVSSSEAFKYNEFAKNGVKIYKPKFSVEAGDLSRASVGDIIGAVDQKLSKSNLLNKASILKLANLLGIESSNQENINYLTNFEGNNEFNFLDSSFDNEIFDYLTNSIVKFQV